MMIVFAITRWPSLMPESLQNFSAAYAVAFCAGVYFTGKWRWILPLGALLLMDLVLNFFYYKVAVLDGYTVVKLLVFAAIVWVGTCFRPRSSWFALVGGGILGALLFYLFTNIASWLYDPGYPKTLNGLFQALTTGLPGFPPTWTFFRNTLLSGGLFTGLFCGVMKLFPAEKEAEETESEEGEAEPVPEEA